MKRKYDLVILFIWPIIAALLSIIFKANLLTSTILFLVIPSVYLSIRERKSVKKILVFTLASIPLLFIFEYLGVKGAQWYFPQSMFQARILGTIVFEMIIWYFFWVYLILIYYEYFLDKDKLTRLYNSRLKYPFFIFVAMAILLLFLIFYKVSVFIPYFYLIGGIILVIIPLTLMLFSYPHLLNKFTKATLYFLYLYLVMDLTAISLGHWVYPGKFIGWFDIFGLAFPVEELFIWVILSAAAVLSWYEYFSDDQK